MIPPTWTGHHDAAVEYCLGAVERGLVDRARQVRASDRHLKRPLGVSHRVRRGDQGGREVNSPSPEPQLTGSHIPPTLDL